MKVDIDGHEPAFLRGAMSTLDRLRPTMIIEIVPECLEGGWDTAVQVCRTLISLGYRLSDGQSTPCDLAEPFLARFPSGINALCQAR
jgi:hypothetical protein